MQSAHEPWPSARLAGSLLVCVQLGCLAFLALTGPVLPRAPVGLVLALAGVALGGWALFTMRRSRWRVHPLPSPDARLVTRGPYARVRHPMYLAVLLVAAGWWAESPSGPRLMAWVLLLADLLCKARIEERALSQRFPDYPAYQRRSGRLFPRLF